jgi:hypothetical protein
MKHQSKHTSHELSHEQEQLSQAQSQQTSAREFASAEEALREDRARVSVPPAVEQRLNKSIESLPRSLPKPGKPWWKRLMGD